MGRACRTNLWASRPLRPVVWHDRVRAAHAADRAVGMLLLVRAWQRGDLAPPWRFHVSLLLAGWGTFNLVEGLVDHHPEQAKSVTGPSQG